MATKKDISTNVDLDNNTITIEFANGNIIELRADDLNATITKYATLHGLKQKLVDAGAISRNPETGKSATIEDKYNAINEVFERLVNEQEWNKTREGGAPRYGLLLTALIELYPAKDVDELKEFINSKTKAECAALRLNSSIAPIIEELKLRKVQDIDTDNLLSDLE